MDMNDSIKLPENNAVIVENILSRQFGVFVLGAGIINIFWGHDTLFGIFITLLSLFYFLPVNAILDKLLGFTIPKMFILKILLGILIMWVVVGVGDLFDKIQLMRNDL